MKWYIIGLLYFHPDLNIEPHVMLNTERRYESFAACHKDMTVSRSVLQKGIMAKFPNLNQFVMKCMNERDVLSLQLKLKKKKNYQSM